MFKLGYNEFLGQQVLVSDWRLVRDQHLRSIMRKNVWRMSAAVALPAFDKEYHDALRKHWLDAGDVASLDIADKVDLNKSMIVIDKGLLEILSKDECLALVHHERGHIINGDLESIGRGDEMMKEMRADAYAAMLVGKKNMYNTLIKAMQYQCSLVDKDLEDPNEYMAESMELNGKRFMALL